MLPVQTARLKFREMTIQDLDDMAQLLGDPAVMHYYSSPKNPSEVRKWIAWNQNNYATHGYGLWIIETHDGGFVGDCGLTWQEVNGVPKLEVGYHVLAAFQGSGYATEAATACREFARNQVGTPELVAITHPDNIASQRVAQKIGMHRAEDDHGGTPTPRTVLSMVL